MEPRNNQSEVGVATKAGDGTTTPDRLRGTAVGTTGQTITTATAIPNLMAIVGVQENGVIPGAPAVIQRTGSDKLGRYGKK